MNDKLQELYARKSAFEMYGSTVPQRLLDEIAEAEAEAILTYSDNIIRYLPDEVDMPKGRLVVGAEYIDGKLVRVGASSDLDFVNAFSNVNDVDKENDEDVSDDDDDDDSDSARKRSKSIGFTVKFADGKVIKHSTARRTMIESLCYMGLERASHFRGEMFKGYPLIGKQVRPAEPGRQWQKNVDGWLVYVNMGNPRAIACIKGVASMLNIPVEIIMDEEGAELQPPVDKPKGKRAKYSLNGVEPAWKNRTVWNAVRNLLIELPNATFKEISDFFPKSLQGSYGVIATIADIEERSKRNKSEYNRWFLDPSDILTAGDGTKFTVTTEWGDNFDNFRNHVIREFGWTITEV